MRPPPPAPCRITAISGLSRRCSKAKWTRRANQWCRRPGVPLCQLRRNELGLGASRAPEGAGRARSCPLSLQKCFGKPRSPPMSFGLGDVGCEGGRAGVHGSQADFSCCPPASFWAAWFWGAARAPRSGLVAPCHLVCLPCPAPVFSIQQKAAQSPARAQQDTGTGRAEPFTPLHPILGPVLLARTGSITELQTPAARPEPVPGPGAQPSPNPTSPQLIPVPRATSPSHSPLVPAWGRRPAHRPAAPVRRHVAVDLEARGVVRGEDGVNPILLLSARVDVKAVSGPGAWSGAHGDGVGKREAG